MNETTQTFFTAIKAGDVETVRTLLDADPALIQSVDENGVSPILVSIYYQQDGLTSLLVSRKPALDIFEASAVGETARLEEILSGKEADINAFSADGFQAIGLAAFFGRLEAARLLIDRFCEIDTPSRNSLSVTPLNSAVAPMNFGVAGQHLAIAQELLRFGADPNGVQAGGFTPLHSAAQNGQKEMIEALIAHGAELDVKNAEGQTAYDLAMAAKHTHILSLLK